MGEASELREGACPADGTAAKRLTEMRSVLSNLMPLVLGIALARSASLGLSYTGYTQTDAGVFTEGVNLVKFGIFALFALLLALRADNWLSKTSVNRIMLASTALLSGSLIVTATLSATHALSDGIRFALYLAGSTAGSVSVFYWLRKARGCAASVAALFAFVGLGISEMLVFASGLLGETGRYAICFVYALAQLPCILKSRTVTKPAAISLCDEGEVCFVAVDDQGSDRRFLAMSIIGIALISFVDGLLRGWPNGDSIALTPPTRLACMLLMLGACALVCWLVATRRSSLFSTGAWFALQLLAIFALLGYALAPNDLEYGAIFATMLNAVIIGIKYYLTIAFMTYGKRDPYFYALIALMVFLAPRALARMSFALTDSISLDAAGMDVFTALLIVLSGQFVFFQLCRAHRRTSADSSDATQENAAQKATVMERFMGLDQGKSLADVRRESTEEAARLLEHEFGLTERETAVLSLYALGYTQARVAEELFISESTVRTHVKNIYAKTGFHSRQEIVDHIQAMNPTTNG